MSKRAKKLSRTVAGPAASEGSFLDTFRGRMALVLGAVVLLWLAFVPVRQFYLAWVGLVPWLILVARAKTQKSVFWWSWLAGMLYFWANSWWLVYVTLPGAAGLMLYMGIWFALAGVMIKALGLLELPEEKAPSWRSMGRILGSLFLLAAIWAAQEWVRGWLFTGFPWLFLGHTQTPFLAMCQVADITGALGVTVWVVLINGWVALYILHRSRRAQLIRPGIAIAGLLVVILVYGIWRMNQGTSYPGPRVMVVQSNFPQDNSGDKGADLVEIARFHLFATRDALDAARANNTMPDLVVWSETMMPEINPVYRNMRRCNVDVLNRMIDMMCGLGHVPGFGRRQDQQREFYDLIYEEISKMARKHGVNMLVGASTTLPDREAKRGDKWLRMNSAILFFPDGKESSVRYDKIHLVPFGEYIPFRESAPLLFRFFNIFNPYANRGDYTLTPGRELSVFRIGAPTQWEFVAPICFEDVDGPLVARMFSQCKPSQGRSADFIVNLTNDGWFRWSQMPQHLQIAQFRSIENRVPTARSVNTGISGFIDPVGRTHDLLDPNVTGVSTARITLDRRTTFYTHHAGLFESLCGLAAGIALMVILARGMKNRIAGRR